MEGKVVLVTGGTGFLGSSVCRAFAEVNAGVVAIYLFDRELPFFRKTLGRFARASQPSGSSSGSSLGTSTT